VVDGCVVVPYENEEEDDADDSLRLWVGCRSLIALGEHTSLNLI